MDAESDYYVELAGGRERVERLEREEAERKFRGYLWHCQRRDEVPEQPPDAYAAKVLGRNVKRDLSDVTTQDFATLKRALNKARKWENDD